MTANGNDFESHTTNALDGRFGCCRCRGKHGLQVRPAVPTFTSIPGHEINHKKRSYGRRRWTFYLSADAVGPQCVDSLFSFFTLLLPFLWFVLVAKVYGFPVASPAINDTRNVKKKAPIWTGYRVPPWPFRDAERGLRGVGSVRCSYSFVPDFFFVALA